MENNNNPNSKPTFAKSGLQNKKKISAGAQSTVKTGNTPNAKASADTRNRPKTDTARNVRKVKMQSNNTITKQTEAENKRLRNQILREEKERKKQLRKYNSKRITAFVTLVVMTFLVMSILFSVIFFINLLSHKKPDTNDYSLVLSDYNNELQIKSGNVVDDNGERYVNFSQIAEFYNFAMVGSIADMKYIVKGDESETISFAVGSDIAEVNTVKVKMPGKAFYQNGDLYVSEEFISNYINGLDISTDSKKKTYSVSRVLLNTLDSDGKIADGKPAEYEAISFKLKAPIMSVSIAEDDTAVVMPSFEFNSDLSAYEDYMNPGSTTEFLTLVNADHKLSSDYIPTGLSLLNVGSGMYLKEYAAMSFKAMYKEATACGITGITVSKAYVSYDELEKEYKNTIEKYTPLLGAQQAQRYADATVSSPGRDEHQTGLTFDFGTTNGADFTATLAYVWFCENSHKFGFIQRYPTSKSEITGVASSPNQFRYVGRYHAVRMNALGLTLDEYVEYLGI